MGVQYCNWCHENQVSSSAHLCCSQEQRWFTDHCCGNGKEELGRTQILWTVQQHISSKKKTRLIFLLLHIYVHWLQIKIMYSFSSYCFFWEETALYGQLHGFYISSKFWSTIKSTSLWQLLMNMLGKKLGLVTSITSHAGGIWTKTHLTDITAEFI